jgi:glycosyltransferase involved in cell wall biosynthesis
MKTISVCMIVKNEERFLENCLNSIKNLADEIIIVDTGSTDNTKRIAEKFTDKIFDFKWTSDFSEARNFSLSKASGDWILVIDADESINQKDIEKIKKILEEPEANAYHLIWRDYTNKTGVLGWKSSHNDEYPESKTAAGFSEHRVLRLFENKKEYFFEGKIHETVQNSIEKTGGKIFLSDIVIHHQGNLRKEHEILEKKEKYSEMLKERLGENEKEKFFVLFEIARELAIKQDFTKAKEYLQQSIELNSEFSPTLVMLGAIFILEKKFNEAEKLLKKAVVIDSMNADIHANLGVIYSEKQEYSKAIRKFERAIELNPKSADNFFNLGLVYLKQGKESRAIPLFEKAIELNPKYKERIKFS